MMHGAPDLVGEPPFQESVLIQESVGDLLAADALGAVIHLDTVHERLVRGLVSNGAAASVGGARALFLASPSVGSLSWSDIDEMRRVRGLDDLRRVLGEAEAAAVAAARGGSQDRAIREELFNRTVAMSERAGLGAWLGAAKRAAISTVVGATPIGIPVEFAREVRATRQSTGTWLAALHELKDRAGDFEPKEGR